MSTYLVICHADLPWINNWVGSIGIADSFDQARETAILDAQNRHNWPKERMMPNASYYAVEISSNQEALTSEVVRKIYSNEAGYPNRMTLDVYVDKYIWRLSPDRVGGVK